MPGLRYTFALFCAPLLAGASSAADYSNAARTSSVATTPSAYRAYAGTQAEMLVRMTRVLARDIGSGDVDAARNDYPMAHGYLARIAPALAQDRDLATRMDASAENFKDKARDPDFSGFHRIEHDLFASRSTQGLAVVADRLHDDAVLLQKKIATEPMPPDVLIDAAAWTIEAISARTLGGEPYAKTDLWDVEANLGGAQEIVAALRPYIEARDPLAMARITAAFAKANTRLAESQEGCGFKSFDALTSAEKTSLGERTSLLARELSKLKAVPAID